MSRKTVDPEQPNEDDGSWDYRVVRFKGCRVIFGEHPPIGDMHALLRQWEISGSYRWLSTRLARRWGAVVVVCKSIGDEAALLEDPEMPFNDCEDDKHDGIIEGIERRAASVLPGERNQVEAADEAECAG